ncbi:hypothetical protein JW935_08965 [candidate division KSB1 bacterium]|nr:hypothetical protein [candidate division KSB1 bacterium]
MKKILLIALLFVSGCEIDHGLGPLKSRITGKISFVNENFKPDNIDALRPIAVTKWDPENFSLSDIVIANTSVNMSKENPDYYIPAPLGSYELVAIVYRKKGQGWNYTQILGFYGFDPVTYTGESKIVTLSKTKPIAGEIDIVCDWTWAVGIK